MSFFAKKHLTSGGGVCYNISEYEEVLFFLRVEKNTSLLIKINDENGG